MKGTLITAVGTLGCRAIARTKRLQGGTTSSRVRFLGIDTQNDDPGLQDLEPNEFVSIGQVPLDDIRQHTTAYGPLVNGLFMEQLDNHPSDLQKGGCLYPTATLLGVRFHQATIEGMFTTALGRLLTPENNITELEVWVVGSVGSTTGRGALVEVCILLRRLLQGFTGINTLLSCVVVGCQGLHPDKLAERQTLEAGFWVEYNAAMEGHPIPRSHDAADGDWRGTVADQTFHVCARSSTWQLESIDHVEGWIAAWLAHTVLQPAVDEILSGARIRFRPQIAGRDRGERDPKRTFLSLAGFTAVTMQLPAVQRYGQARLADQVLSHLLGEAPADTGHLITTLGLHLSTLEERLEFSSYSTMMTQEIGRLIRTLKDTPRRQWSAFVQTTLVNLEQLVQQAHDQVPTKRGDIQKDMEEHLKQQLFAPRHGVLHVVKSLEDVQAHLAQLHDQAIAQLRTLKRIDQVRTEVNQACQKVRLFQRSRQLEAIQAHLRGVEETIRIVLNDAIIRLLAELGQFVAGWLKTAREGADCVDATRAIATHIAEAALQRPQESSVLVLVEEEAEFEALITPRLNPLTIQVLADELVAKGHGESVVEGLAGFKDPAHLSASIFHQIEAHGYFKDLDQDHFLALFHQKYPTASDQQELFRWLYEKAEAPGGGIDVGYGQQTRAVPPGEQTRIIVPSTLLPLAQNAFSVVAPRLPAGALCGIDHVGLIVASREVHHVPLYAQSYFRRIAGYLPQSPKARRKYITAEWALAVKDYIPYEPFATWNGHDLVLLGLALNVLEEDTGTLSYRDSQIGVSVEVGRFADATHAVTQNGHRAELVTLIEDALNAQTWPEVTQNFGTLANRLPAYGQAVRPVYYQLQTEWTQLMQVAGVVPTSWEE